MSLLAVLSIINALVPVVRAAVSTAESVFGPGRGSEKLSHAVSAVEEALPQVDTLARNIDAARAAARPLIEATVAAANVAGDFKRSAPRPSTRPAPRRRSSKKRRR